MVPRLPVHQLLAKFNGRRITQQFRPKAHIKKIFRLTRLPKYLILNCDRKESQNFSNKGRNCTVITFPIRNLEICSICGIHEDHFNCPASLDLESMSEDSLKSLLDEYEDLVPSCHKSSDSLMNRAKLLAQACHITRYHLCS